MSPAASAMADRPYLATLASDLEGGDFGDLPDTQDQQRLAIIEWRTRLDGSSTRAGGGATWWRSR